MSVLRSQFSKEYMTNLKAFLDKEIKTRKVMYPKPSEFFNAFNEAPFDKVKVVILGQDPYHGEGQAHGLCFSVREGIKPPPSLVNIFKELKSDVSVEIPRGGCLDYWATQGVLLLNATLSVEAGRAGSHQKRGWEEFTNEAIKCLNEKRENLVFILWGAYAQKKQELIDGKKHLILKSVHPSPLSAHRGFFGSKPFSKTNKYLVEHYVTPIDWNLSNNTKNHINKKVEQ